ncbi:MAG: lipoyl synthase [Gammaproteobacteria bacterium]|uniref:Lipoyl synthase n=1 Tax=Marinobacter nitratireducens TaxID=1137280 RepID=A0A072N0Z5_9GAMM|nr:lipoyl synthase [Marinobacter nitratireducens]KEF31161.1 Lipoate synthase [Marinobacter nitratireducens]TNE72439.1 MAG: lipoyl synthase [Gammaproteobacteria bacterium]TNE99197.1 MAG: lipoyl synthase [Gammaproteobacteria bacterium]
MSESAKPRITSGTKFRNEHGFSAIKDGVKRSSNGDEVKPVERKPKWLRARMPGGERYDAVRRNVTEHKLSTVCQESHCPNIGECWTNGTATIMVMGSVCTRACKFCAVDTGNPKGWLDKDEPENTAKSVELMGLRYIVLTSVDRDDLEDGGAAHYAACVSAIKQRTPEVAVEALTPDFDAVMSDVEKVVDSGLDVFAQNVETVERLTSRVRDPRAGYQKTLSVLEHAKKHNPGVLTKTSLMLGLGETEEEILQTMDDLRAIGVDILTLGQYLRPTPNHLPVERYVTPEEFNRFRDIGLDKGFMEVPSGPMVRSSYRADKVFDKNNLGLAVPEVPETSNAMQIPVKAID